MYYLENWTETAEEKGALLIAPVFDQPNFGSKTGFEYAWGGYRGLFGREIGADEFLLEIVDHYQAEMNFTDRRFYLYGHSAGGQFAGRMLVRHPQRLKGVVISSALTYPSPDVDVVWPFGRGELRGELEWVDPQGTTYAEVVPMLEDWISAGDVPVTVLVGMNDLEPQLDWPGQQGNNRLVIARNWVEEFNAFLESNVKEGRIILSMIPGTGHSAGGLFQYAQEAMFGDL
jgi:hypothetical protein